MMRLRILAGKLPVKLSSRSGLTLIEVVISTGLVLLGLATFLGAMDSMRRVSVAADRRMRAMHRARMVLEDLMSLPYTSSSLNVGNHTLDDASYNVAMASGFTTTKDISVTVAWDNPGNETPQQLTLYGSMAWALHRE